MSYVLNWSCRIPHRRQHRFRYIFNAGIAHWEAGIAHWESVHARKWITSTVADRTSSLPDVSGMHGFAACRPRHERIREPRLRVRQVLHDESRSCGDWSNEISQRQGGESRSLSQREPYRRGRRRRPCPSKATSILGRPPDRWKRQRGFIIVCLEDRTLKRLRIG